MQRSAIGLGSNVGTPARTLRAALVALQKEHDVVAVSSFYETQPWGVTDQPAFVNAVAIIETQMTPHELLRSLKSLEAALGRAPTYRWGPRVIDLDILLYDDLRIEEPELRIPHPHLAERAFVLVPLAEVDARFVELRDRLHPDELRKVKALHQSESSASMSDLIDRVRNLAAAFIETDLVRLRIEEPNEDAIEFRRKSPISPAQAAQAAEEQAAAEAPKGRIDAIKADLVGIAHLGRPTPVEGEILTVDRELGHVEALGIRTAVRSLGPGRIAAIRVEEGQPVEYGQVLFEIDRG